jgi:hypothetical protein
MHRENPPVLSAWSMSEYIYTLGAQKVNIFREVLTVTAVAVAVVAARAECPSTPPVNMSKDQLNDCFREIVNLQRQLQSLHIAVTRTRFPQTGGVFRGAASQSLGRHDFCAISDGIFGSTAVGNDEQWCKLSESSGIWTFQNGKRIDCAVTCIDAILVH